MTRASRFHRGNFLIALAAASCLAPAAWAIGPDYHRPDLGLTKSFHTPPPADPQASDSGLVAWWGRFGDPELSRVVERAVAQNLDLAQARARVLQSRAAAKAAGAALLPRADAAGGVSHDQFSLLSPIGAVGRKAPGFERDYADYGLGAAASWEIDLFGGLRRARDAARSDARAALAEAAAVRVSVAAEAADAYLQARAYQGRLAVARRQQQTEQDLVDLLVRRTAEGVSPERELNEARAELEAVRASIPPLQAGLDAELNRLDVLMGAQPGTYREELTASDAPPAALPVPDAGDGPAGLLRRRPDVLAAEQRLIAANARIGEALAEYYPKLSISGLIGLDSISASRLFTGNAVTHQVGAGLRWRLFDFGRVDAEVAAAKGREAEALSAYRATVLKAAEEVEDAFSDLTQQQARAAALAREVDALTQARAQAEQAYEGGVSSLIEVRDADRQLLAASDQLVQARAGASRAAVACFRALGGGWAGASSGAPVAANAARSNR
jgi:NodT family efflux transporter outer membrane factor (OMF) lipoprotein